MPHNGSAISGVEWRRRLRRAKEVECQSVQRKIERSYSTSAASACYTTDEFAEALGSLPFVLRASSDSGWRTRTTRQRPAARLARPESWDDVDSALIREWPQSGRDRTTRDSRATALQAPSMCGPSVTGERRAGDRLRSNNDTREERVFKRWNAGGRQSYNGPAFSGRRRPATTADTPEKPA